MASVGVVTGISLEDQELRVLMDEEEGFTSSFDELDELTHAYAVSIHRKLCGACRMRAGATFGPLRGPTGYDTTSGDSRDRRRCATTWSRPHGLTADVTRGMRSPSVTLHYTA